MKYETTLKDSVHNILPFIYYMVEHLPMLGVVKSLLSGVSTLSASCSVTDSRVLPAIVLSCVYVQILIISRTQITLVFHKIC